MTSEMIICVWSGNFDKTAEVGIADTDTWTVEDGLRQRKLCMFDILNSIVYGGELAFNKFSVSYIDRSALKTFHLIKSLIIKHLYVDYRGFFIEIISS